jgi:YesN/AraC family two-component response regulator
LTFFVTGNRRMQRPLLLRIDFTRDARPIALPPASRGLVDLRNLRDSVSLFREIVAVQPDVLCFDYDCPDVESLERLRAVKNAHPSFPILMLTEHSSEDLVLWALRSRVWDYFVKPLDVAAFLKAVQQLHELRNRNKRGAAREIVIPASRTGGDRTGDNAAGAAERAVSRTKAYVSQNYAEKISAREVAGLCNMSPFHFSRIFKRICGITFSEYLLEVRIRKAIDLLSRETASVTGACYEVGFRDPSYFSRIFRRYAGMTPSEYRERYLKSLPNRSDKDSGGNAHKEETESSSDPRTELLLRLNQR